MGNSLTDDAQARRHRWTDAVWGTDQLKPTQKLVALAYAKHAGNGTDRVWVSTSTLLRHTGLSRDAAYRALKQLRVTGWLTLTEAARQHRSTRYALTIPSSGTGDGQLADANCPGAIHSSTGNGLLHPVDSITSSTGDVPSSTGDVLSAVRETYSNPNNPKEPNPGGGGHNPHKDEQNVVDALTRICRDRRLPFSVDELLPAAYQMGDGDPWTGYKRIRDATEAAFDDADDARRVLVWRLKQAGLSDQQLQKRLKNAHLEGARA